MAFAFELTSGQWTCSTENWTSALSEFQQHLVRDMIPDSLWTVLFQPNSKVSGSNWKLPDRAAMCDTTFDATAAATLDAAILARLFPLLPVTSWERNEAFAWLPAVTLDPEARAGAGAATDSEDTVCVPLVNAMLEGSGAMAPCAAGLSCMRV